MSDYRSIFIVEDDSIIVSSFEQILTGIGYRVAGAAMDGETAERMIKETRPDLLLVDINIPKKSGLELLRSVNAKGFIPAIIITGHYSESLLTEASEVGAFAYVLKPVDSKQLIATVEIARARCREFYQLCDQTDDLRQALEDRKYIERAKGILMDRFGIKEPVAMQTLQKKSKNENKKIVLVAKEIIESEKLLE